MPLDTSYPQEVVGFPPASESILHTNSLALALEHDITKRQFLEEWLVKQGIPKYKATTAKPETIAKAYVNSRYLKAWRINVNPAWKQADALLGAENDTNMDLLDDTGTKLAPKTSQASDAPRTEAWLKDLFANIEKTVTQLVTAKLENTTLKLNPEAKEQIRALARDAAQARIDELAAPRRIEIVHGESGETRDLGLQHERFPTLLRACGARDHRGFRLNIWLTGPTGSGKTSAAESAAKALALPFGSDGSLDADYKVLGFRDANGNIISTQFLDIYEKGGIYVADEIDNWLPSALLSLNAALANGWCASPRGLIRRHPDACVIACANTWGLGATSDYVGRTRLDAASLDRFQPKIDWPIDERLERALAQEQGGQDGTEWHDTVLDARAAAKRQGLKIIISPRATFAGIALLRSGFAHNEVIDMTIASGLSPEQKKAIGVPNAVANVTSGLAASRR